MHTNRETVGFFTVLGMVCYLAFGGFASPAAAETIVVTTLTDIANPPFNADGPCGTGTISDLPGTDGLVSLREAIIAANNTPGADTITFAPNLSSGTIAVKFDDLDADTTPDPLPALCGGHTCIEGDLDGDGDPDITLEGAAFPVAALPVAAAGIFVVSSHNTIAGLHVQHFPIGIRVRAGDFTNPGTVTHTKVTNNIVAESKIDGIDVRTGNTPGSLLAHTTVTQNEVINNARFGIVVVTSLVVSATGFGTHIAYPTITDNDVTDNGSIGIEVVALGDDNIISNATIAHNTVSGNASLGINVLGGYGGSEGNTIDVRIKDNTVADNGDRGIFVGAGQDNSSHNHVVARIEGNTVERNQVVGGIEAVAAVGAVDFLTGTSANNELDVRIERNTVKGQTGSGIVVVGGVGSPNGRARAVADNNQAKAIVMQNTIEDSTGRGIHLDGGGPGLANANTVEVRVAHNTVCNNVPSDIGGTGGFTGSPGFSLNLGTGNMLTGEITKNTATTVTVQNGTPGNTADVTQFKNEPCP